MTRQRHATTLRPKSEPFLPADTLRSHRVQELRDIVQRVTVTHEVEIRGGQPDGRVAVTHIGALDLAYVQYGTKVAVSAYPTQGRFALTVPLGSMRVSNTTFDRAEMMARSFVLSDELHTLMDPDPAAGALIFSSSMNRLEEHLNGMTGRPPVRALRFLPAGDRSAVAPQQLVESSWRLVCQTLACSQGIRQARSSPDNSKTSCFRR